MNKSCQISHRSHTGYILIQGFDLFDQFESYDRQAFLFNHIGLFSV